MDMVEKVARALCRVDGIFSQSDADFWRVMEPDARAAIAAMLEPTPEMLIAAYGPDKRDWRGTERASYRAMVTAALGE